MAAYPSPWNVGARRTGRRLGALATGLVCIALAAGYLTVAWYVVFDLHIGHVVQDGVDTGDLLAVPFVLAATCCLAFATYVWAHAGGREVGLLRASRPSTSRGVPHPRLRASAPPAHEGGATRTGTRAAV